VPNNSNTIPATTDYGSTEMSIPMNTAVEEGDFTEIKQSPMTNPKNTNEKFTKVTPNITGIASGILNAYVAGAVGISMGKTITNILYQVNPDIFNGIDPNTIDYKDYYGNVAGGIFNAILGTDTTTGKTQAYLDINDFAAIALALQNKGVFGSDKNIVNNTDNIPLPDGLNIPFNCYSNVTNAKYVIDVGSSYIIYNRLTFDKPVKSFAFYKNRPNPDFINVDYLFVSSVPFNYYINDSTSANAAYHIVYNSKLFFDLY
jgi:hypothetical protein